MSADYYAVCPKCGKAEDEGLEENHPERTLREDKFIGIRDNIFIIFYTGQCSRCGFKFAFEQKIPLAKKMGK